MTTKPARRSWLWIVLILIMLAGVALLWQQVFVITGIVSTSSTEPAIKLPPPTPPEIEPVSTDWVDLEVYLETHPRWEP